jgi:predicted phage replisome organizer
MANISWIKLSVDMFDNRKIKQIRKLPDGDKIILLWVMLLTLAGKCNMHGYIMLTENIPYTAEMLSAEFDMELNTVKMGLEVFSRFNMIELDDNIVKISGWEEHQNIEGMDKIREQTRARVSAYRERQKLLQQSQEQEEQQEDCNVTVTLRNAIDKNRIDKNKNKNKNKNIYNEQVVQIFNFYKETFDGYFKRLSLTDGRRTKIEARLKDGYTVDDICIAIKNIRKSTFHCGDNDKHMFYATLEFICRNSETLEKWINADNVMKEDNKYGQGRPSSNAGGRRENAIASDKLFTRGLD